MKRSGLHIHFYCCLIVLLVSLVLSNIKATEMGSLYLMVILTIFALMQCQIKNTILMWACFLGITGLLFLYRYYSWPDEIFSRYTFIVMRKALPTFYALCIFGSLPVSEIIAGFDSLHFPKKAGIAVVTLFRYFPSLSYDIKTAHENMKLRNLGGFRNFITYPARTIKCFILPLIVHLHSTVDELAVSATARGAESDNKRFSLYGKKFTTLDGIVLPAMLIALFGVLLI